MDTGAEKKHIGDRGKVGNQAKTKKVDFIIEKNFLLYEPPTYVVRQ